MENESKQIERTIDNADHMRKLYDESRRSHYTIQPILLHLEKQDDMSWVKAEGSLSELADLIFRAAMDDSKIKHSIFLAHKYLSESIIKNNEQ